MPRGVVTKVPSPTASRRSKPRPRTKSEAPPKAATKPNPKPRPNPQVVPPNRRLAVIDIGSASVRMLVVEVGETPATRPAWRALANERVMTRLATGLAGQGKLTDEAIERSAKAVASCLALARNLGVTSSRDVYAHATAAVRDAKNGAAFIDRVREVTRSWGDATTRDGVHVAIVSSREEGRLAYLAASRHVELSKGFGVVADLGGGSLEVVWSRDGIVLGNHSMPIGAVRMTEKFGGRDGPRGAATRGLEPMRRHIARALKAITVVPGDRGVVLCGCGGTFTTLASVVLGGKHKLLAPTRVTREHVADLLERVRLAWVRAGGAGGNGKPMASLSAIPGLPKDRHDVILAGLVAVEALLDRTGARSVVVVPGGVREGHVVTLLESPHIANATPHDGPDPMGTVRAFAGAARYEEAHSEHVTRLALSLYDSLTRRGLVPRDAHERRLLEAGSLLHDVGQFVEYRKHHKHGRDMVLYAGLEGTGGTGRSGGAEPDRERLNGRATPRSSSPSSSTTSSKFRGWTTDDVEIIALLARYHRKSGPSPSHPEFASLTKARRHLVERLVGILRVADGLDRTHRQLVERVRVVEETRRRLVLEAIPRVITRAPVPSIRVRHAPQPPRPESLLAATVTTPDIAEELDTARAKRGPLEQSLGRTVEITGG
ncbi:MAG: Ppx/GppA phosphatase family protein [Phycisphaerales bacterium]